MKHFITSSIYLLACFSLCGCGSPQVATARPTEISAPQFAVSQKTSLEVYRNGKVYEILIGYSMGRAPLSATPMGETPKSWSEIYADSAQIEGYSDFDIDGEVEILVSAFVCGANCSERLIVYDYDPVNDRYRAFDEIWASLREYTDFDKDGRSEFTLYEGGFCFPCSNASDALSALTVLQYEDGKFVDASTKFPELIQQDADSDLNSARLNEQDSAEIFLSGYLFNMNRLGKMEEARKIFDEVCNSVIKPSRSSSNFEFDCAKFRADVEKSITEYRFRP